MQTELMPPETPAGSLSRVAGVMCLVAAIQWISRTQKTSTLSTSEASLRCDGRGFQGEPSSTVSEAFCLPEYGHPCIQVFEDNKGAIQKAVHPVANSNSKHVDARHHFLRERVEKGGFQFMHGEPEYEHADFLTKTLSASTGSSPRILVFFSCTIFEWLMCRFVCTILEGLITRFFVLFLLRV